MFVLLPYLVGVRFGSERGKGATALPGPSLTLPRRERTLFRVKDVWRWGTQRPRSLSDAVVQVVVAIPLALLVLVVLRTVTGRPIGLDPAFVVFAFVVGVAYVVFFWLLARSRGHW